MKDYWRIVMMLSYLVNYLLLLGTNRLCGCPPGGLRTAMAAGLGAAQAGVCLVPGFAFLGGTFWRVVFMCLMALTAFGMQRSAIWRGMLFGLLSLCMEAVAVGGGWAVILAALVILLLCFLGRIRPRVGYVPVTITHCGRTVSLMALPDNGNTLRDPISGASVLIAGRDAAWQLLGLTDDQLAHPIETLASLSRPGLRLIPYTAIGQQAGLLLGCRVDRLLIDGKNADAIVAFAPQRIGQKHTFQALTGGFA